MCILLKDIQSRTVDRLITPISYLHTNPIGEIFQHSLSYSQIGSENKSLQIKSAPITRTSVHIGRCPLYYLSGDSTKLRFFTFSHNVKQNK